MFAVFATFSARSERPASAGSVPGTPRSVQEIRRSRGLLVRALVDQVQPTLATRRTWTVAGWVIEAGSLEVLTKPGQLHILPSFAGGFVRAPEGKGGHSNFQKVE